MSKLSAYDKVKLVRMKERPTSLDYINLIFNTFIEFHGDRYFGDDKCIIGGIAKLGNTPVTIIAQQRGRDTKENIERNFGMPKPEGYRKSLRLMKQAEKFKRPVICFVDTPGAFCGVDAESRGQGQAIANNLFEMSSIKTPIISIIIGEGESGGALALAAGDEIWMLENSIFSVLSPEGLASILFKDAKKAKEASEIMKFTAQDLKEYGIIDGIIDEPKHGAHKDIKLTAKNIKSTLISSLNRLSKLSAYDLLQRRYNKYRNIGR